MTRVRWTRSRRGSVALVVTSPPYFAGKEYEQALGEGHVPATYLDYLQMLEDVFADCVRTLEPGGRIAVNVANLGRKPYRSLAADVIAILQDRLRLLLRGEVIWQKARGAAGNVRMGIVPEPGQSRAARPDGAGRDREQRPLRSGARRARTTTRRATARRLDLEGRVHGGDDRRVGDRRRERDAGSATRRRSPSSCPERLIHLYTYVGDLVLDPFMGSGSTAVAALRAGRHFVGYDTDEAYVEQARRRLARTVAQSPPTVAPAGLEGVARARRSSRAVLLAIERNVKLPQGFEVELSGARDRVGATWLFDVAGGFGRRSRPGLKRADVLWKALGKAAVLHETLPRRPPRAADGGRPHPERRAVPPSTRCAGRRSPSSTSSTSGAPTDLDRLRRYAADGADAEPA